MKETKPYRCTDKNCECNDKNDLMRHCQKCGELFLWNAANKKPCLECQLMSEKEKGYRVE